MQYLVNTIDDLRRPGVEGRRYICSPPLRDASNHDPLWAYVRRGVLESVSTDHCPFTDEQKARGAGRLQPRPQRPAGRSSTGCAKLWDEGVVAGRITPSQLVDRTSTTIARRFGLEAKGAIAPGKDADVVVFDPAAPRPYGVATSFMNVDYDLFEGETASGSVRHTFCRGTLVYDRGEIRTAPGHGRFVSRGRGARGGGGVKLIVDADRVLADLRELRRADRGARRRASPRVVAGLAGGAHVAARQARRAAGDGGARTWPATSGPSCPAAARRRASSSSARTSTQCRPAGGWTACSASSPRSGVLRALAAADAAAGRASGSSTGPTRRARASGAASLGSSACAGTLRSRRRARPARRGRHAAAGRDDVVRRRPRRGARRRRSASTARWPTSSCTSSRGRSCSTPAGCASAVSGTFGDERYLIRFSGQAAHAGSTPMRLRRDALAAAASAALEIREVGIRHDGVTTVGEHAQRARRDHRDRGRVRDDARPAPPRRRRRWRRCCASAWRRARRPPRGSTARSRRGASSAPTPTPFHPRLVELARSAVAEAGGGEGPAIPSGPAARRDRDRPRRSDRDALRAVRSAGLAHEDRGLSRGGAARGDRRLRPDRRRRARSCSSRVSLRRLPHDGLRRRPADRPARIAGDRPRQARRGATASRTRGRSTPICCGRSRSSSTAGSWRRRTSSIVGPMVTNPATRDWTVTASLFATLNEMYGNRSVCGIGRGDSAVRVINGKPVRLAELRAAIGVIRGLANGDAVEYNGTTLRLAWNPDSRLEIWVAAYGPKALSARRRGGRRLHPPARRPGHHRVEHRGSTPRRRGGRPRPRRHHDLRRGTRLRDRRRAGAARPRA